MLLRLKDILLNYNDYTSIPFDWHFALTFFSGFVHAFISYEQPVTCCVFLECLFNSRDSIWVNVSFFFSLFLKYMFNIFVSLLVWFCFLSYQCILSKNGNKSFWKNLVIYSEDWRVNLAGNLGLSAIYLQFFKRLFIFVTFAPANQLIFVFEFYSQLFNPIFF